MQLLSRHVLMIALGSAIGTGFFFGTGDAINSTGVSILLAYLIGGIIMYIIVRALGEMSVAEPNSGSFSYYSYKYIGDFAGFATGWNYWFNYIIVCMIELKVAAIFANYWFPIDHSLFMLIVLSVFFAINMLQVRIFGEFEFWFTGVKITTIVCMIIFSLYIIFHTGFITSSHNISDTKFFAHGLNGFLSSFVVVIFSFGGAELIGITAGDTDNPEKTIPKAINAIIWRIVVFYIFTLALIMCLYPWAKLNHNLSPFVDVFAKIGIPSAASIVNVIAITAALSSLNSGIYGTSRMIYNLSIQNNAPKFLSKTKNKLPFFAVITSVLCIAIVVLLNQLYENIFTILLGVATIAAIINWMSILIVHYRFKKKNKNTKYSALIYPASSIVAFMFLLIIAIKMSSDMKTIIIAPVWLLLLAIAYRIKHFVRKV